MKFKLEIKLGGGGSVDGPREITQTESTLCPPPSPKNLRLFNIYAIIIIYMIIGLFTGGFRGGGRDVRPLKTNNTKK